MLELENVSLYGHNQANGSNTLQKLKLIKRLYTKMWYTALVENKGKTKLVELKKFRYILQGIIRTIGSMIILAEQIKPKQ